MTGQENVLTINVHFIDFMGDVESAMFLSQLIYWSDRAKRKDGFIYKSAKEWHEELGLSEYAVRKARRKLEDIELLETKVKKANGNPTTHYRLNKEAFTSMFTSFLKKQRNETLKSQEGNFENEESLTEITTEITTDIKDKGRNGISPFSYISFNQFVKEQSPNIDDVVKSSIEYFMSVYNQTMHELHPKLTVDQWEEIANTLYEVEDRNGRIVDIDDEMPYMIDNYFQTHFDDCNYSILHFNSGGVKAIRYYNVLDQFNHMKSGTRGRSRQVADFEIDDVPRRTSTDEIGDSYTGKIDWDNI